jgi:hypothetical protein
MLNISSARNRGAGQWRLGNSRTKENPASTTQGRLRGVLKQALCRWKEGTWPIEVAHSLHPNNCPNQQHLGATAAANQRPELTRNTVPHRTTELSGRAKGDHWSDSVSLAVVEAGGVGMSRNKEGRQAGTWSNGTE